MAWIPSSLVKTNTWVRLSRFFSLNITDSILAEQGLDLEIDGNRVTYRISGKLNCETVDDTPATKDFTRFLTATLDKWVWRATCVRPP